MAELRRGDLRWVVAIVCVLGCSSPRPGPVSAIAEDAVAEDAAVADTLTDDAAAQDGAAADMLTDDAGAHDTEAQDGVAQDSVAQDSEAQDSEAQDTTTGDAAASDDGAAADAQAGEPWPLPTLDEEPSPTCQAAIDDAWYFQYLDNLCDEKVWPTDQDRDRACPVDDPSATVTLQDGSVVTYAPSSEPVVWDTTALDGLLPPAMRVAVILIKRVGGVPHYRYLSGGQHDVAAQPWSTTKILAAANAAATLRIASDYKVGLTAKAGAHDVGDLVTSVCNYDASPFTSNGLGRWFHNVGGRAKANALIGSLWLDRPAAETFGGNYGDQAPAVPYSFTEPDGATVSVPPDNSQGPANNLSMHTLAESLKRLVLHREEPEQRLPGIQWKDIRVLLFGAENSAKYGPWGGMTRDTAIYLQAGHDIDYIEQRSAGQWTIFSKLGLGSQGQFMNLGYACWPALDSGGAPIPGLGREFVISTHLDQGGATWDGRDRLLAKTYRKIIIRIMDGRL